MAARPPSGANVEIEFFKASIALAVSEAHQIWGRFNIFVVTNAIALGLIGGRAIGGHLSDVDALGVVVGSVFGLALVWCWRRMTIRGWQYFYMWMDQANELRHPNRRNPIAAHYDYKDRTSRGGLRAPSIRSIALQVIAIFAIAHALMLAVGIWWFVM